MRDEPNFPMVGVGEILIFSMQEIVSTSFDRLQEEKYFFMPC